MILKIAIVLVTFSLVSSILYGTDKITSENPSDSALIRIGLSSIDSSSCEICSDGGSYYNSGCKRCIQDGIVLTSHSINGNFYNLAWSNDNGMYYGDKNCSGDKKLNNSVVNKNETYYIEIIKNDLAVTSNFYNDENFVELHDSVSINMCSNPTNLQYLRISNEDGKSIGNGGKIYGHIDDIKIWNDLNKNIEPLFYTSFNDCVNNTCNDLWTLQNPERIFIDPQKHFLKFFSEVTGTNDYAHLKLDEYLPNSWIMRFILHIDELEEHPGGKGIFNIEPIFRQLFFGIPALVFPLIAYTITRKVKQRSLGIFIAISGIIIFGGLILNLNTLNEHIINNDIIRLSQFFAAISVSIIIIILGIFKMKQFKG